MSMKKMLYFAVCGGDARKPFQNCGLAFGGFCLQTDGQLSAPYEPPANAVVMFDDRVVPTSADCDGLQVFLERHSVEAVIFDFEKPPSGSLCALVRSVRNVQIILPPQYAGAVNADILVPPYLPRESFAAYISRFKQRYGEIILDLRPIRHTLCRGVCEPDADTLPSGRPSVANYCQYAAVQKCGQTMLRFYDTQKTVLSRAAASGLPCLLPLAEFDKLPSG